jgi:ABC-2 type transport system ATP-binding protein
MAETGPVLSVVDVAKRFGAIAAVDGLSFDVAPGECFGLLGPNGAGKTTTLSMIASLVLPDSGRVLVQGRDVSKEAEAVRRALGYVPQDLSLYVDLTARENLAFFGGLYDLRGPDLAARVDEALAHAGLADRANDRVGTFSGGMKRRLNFAIGLIHQPTLVLLDEPTVGVDPQSRNHLFEMVAGLSARGVTVVYTTHYMEEAERLCDRIAIMDHGRLAGVGTRDELIQKIGASEQVELQLGEGMASDAPAAVAALEGLPATRRDGIVTIPVGSASALQDILARCSRHSVPLKSVTLRKPDLEAVFLALTGRGLRD